MTTETKLGVPNPQDLMPDDLRQQWCNSNRNKVHSKCNAFESFWSCSPSQSLVCFPQNQSLVPKRLCTTELNSRMDRDPGSTDADAEAPALWPTDVKNLLIGKVSDAGKDWGQEEKGVTEDEIVGWHHPLDGHEFEQTLWDSEGQGSLAYCSPQHGKELVMT